MGRANGNRKERNGGLDVADVRFGGYKNVYVLDTSVMVHDPYVIEKLADNIIVVPIWLISELDNVKKYASDRGESAREASRRLDSYLKQGAMVDGVKTRAGGLLITAWNKASSNDWMDGLPLNNDARIIMLTKYLKQKFVSKKVVLISKDRNLRLMADAMRVGCEDYFNDKVVTDLGDLYTGQAEIKLEPREEFLLTELHSKGRVGVRKFSNANEVDQQLNANQCCRLLYPGKNPALAVLHKSDKAFEFVLVKKDYPFAKSRGVFPKNDGQHFLYHHILDPEISLVTAVGKAGTGKTLISLLAGINMIADDRLTSMQVYRPMNAIDKDLGILPGGMEEKFAPWSFPVYDNLRKIKFTEVSDEYDKEKSSRKPPQNRPMKDMFQSAIPKYIRTMIEAGIIEISPLTYIRGRSLPSSLIIIDEAQNITPHTAKTAITRAGEGAKVILVGDPAQIDNTTLDATSCGLVHVVEKFKGKGLHAHVTLTVSERSPLAEMAADIL